MAQKDRLESISTIVKSEERVVVSELSKQFRVTEETIRRDLEKLESQGLLTRTYGGAVLNGWNASTRVSYMKRSQSNIAEKQAIARIAASLIPKRKIVIGADSSSTVIETIKLLCNNSNILLMTYAVNILMELADSDMKIMSTGGLLNSHSYALQGVIARNTIKIYNMDVLFISCKGMVLDAGIFDSDDDEVEIKQLMAKKAAKVILLADHTKFNRLAFAELLDFDQVDTIVTDCKPSDDWIAALNDRNVDLLYPNK